MLLITKFFHPHDVWQFDGKWHEGNACQDRLEIDPAFTEVFAIVPSHVFHFIECCGQHGIGIAYVHEVEPLGGDFFQFIQAHSRKIQVQRIDQYTTVGPVCSSDDICRVS